MSPRGIYLVEIILLVGGLAIGAYLLNIPTPWIVGGAIVVSGFGIVYAVRRM